MVATLSGIPVSRITRNITRMANSDGIIAMSRAAPLRNTTRKARKMMRGGEDEALRQRGDQVLGDLRLQQSLSDQAHAASAQGGTG